MKKFTLILTFFLEVSSIWGAVSAENCNTMSPALLDQLIVRARSIKFDKNSPEVGESYQFFGGQNILNARYVYYPLWYNKGECSIEMLYGLYQALQEVLSTDGQRFRPNDLNSGFTKDNYEFVKQIFEEPK